MTLVFPTARRASDQVFVQAIDDELVLYDLQRDKSHALNETAAFVFEHCDGKTSPAQLSALLAERHDLDPADATELMWLSLDRLEQANLLTAPVERPGAMTRRQVLKRAGIAAAVLPVVYSITAPAAAAMASDVPCGDPCTPALSRCQPPCECTLVGGGDGMSPFGGGGGTNICCERTTGGNCPGGDGMSPSGGGCTGVEADPQCCSGWRNMTTGQCCDCAGDG